MIYYYSQHSFLEINEPFSLSAMLSMLQ